MSILHHRSLQAVSIRKKLYIFVGNIVKKIQKNMITKILYQGNFLGYHYNFKCFDLMVKFKIYVYLNENRWKQPGPISHFSGLTALCLSNCLRLSRRETKRQIRVQGLSMFFIFIYTKNSKILLYNWNFFWNGQNIVASCNPEPCSSWLYCYTYRSLTERFQLVLENANSNKTLGLYVNWNLTSIRLYLAISKKKCDFFIRN